MNSKDTEDNKDTLPSDEPVVTRRQKVTRVPDSSTFYGKVLPMLLVFLAVLTILLIIAGVAVVLDIIPHG